MDDKSAILVGLHVEIKNKLDTNSLEAKSGKTSFFAIYKFVTFEKRQSNLPEQVHSSLQSRPEIADSRLPP